jgi:transposase
MKWTIAMTQEELKRKTIIEQAIDKRITQREGADKVGISERHFRRLLKRYREQGDEGLVSGHRGKASNNRMNTDTREEIVRFIADPIYTGFGPTLLNEFLERTTGISISRESLRQIMIEEEKHYPKMKRKTRIHPPRERRCRRGELIQIDGCYHAWLEERAPKACLLLFVDDATSAVVAARFVDRETYFAYGALCKSYFKTKGVPVAFYSDKFSVFRVNSRAGVNKQAITQFSRALNALGVELICANSPQAKGRVERANQTFQDRLVKELRLQRINNYQDANAYLPIFLAAYNRKFAVLPRSTADAHAPLDPAMDLDFLFSVHDTRMISKDLLIRYHNLTYQIVTSRPPQNLIGREVLTLEDEQGKLSVFLNRQQLSLRVLQVQPNQQPRIVSSKSFGNHSYTPPVDHPWRTYGKKLNGKPVPVPDF